MIIDEIKLKNIGVFHGQNSVLLTPPSAEKNIILFGGMNGAGKTTLLESIQLGLFGRQAVHLKKSVSYEKQLRKITSRTVKGNKGSAIEIVFRIKLKGVYVAYRLIRSWEERNGKVSEKLEVFVNNMFDAVLSDSWSEEVERFLPPRLSHLFFFDGEKIESLANPKTSRKILENAIVSLLGVDVVDQVNSDLRILISKKLKETLPTIHKEQIQSLESELSSVVKEERSLKDKRAGLQANLDHALSNYHKSQADYADKGGHLLQMSARLKEKFLETEALLFSNRLQLKQIASGPMPLHLLKKSVEEIRGQLAIEKGMKKSSILEVAFKERDKKVISKLKERDCSETLVEDIQFFLEEDRQKLLEIEGEIIYDMDAADEHLIDLLVNGLLKDSVLEASKLLAENDMLEDKLAAIEKELSRIPDEEQVRDSFLEMRRREDLTSNINKDIITLDGQLESLAIQKERLINELERILGKADEALIQSEEQARVVEYSNKTRTVMSTFKVKVIEKYALQLEILIAKAFKTLLRKDHLIDSVKIDPKDCLLSLYDVKGDEVFAEDLSAGERQLLATAILWALGQASGSNLPVVIDTPLGRLDSVHRSHLLERYFPEASHQVILLSTDEEIDLEAEKVLGGRVGRHYVLNYNDKLGATAVQEGYFGGKLA